MALSGSTRERHFDLDQCLRFLESKNSEKHSLNHAVSRYQKIVTSGPDSFLLLFQKYLRHHDVKKVLSYLRNFEILDEADCERISCESISDLMVTELVTMMRTKDPHAFWYFTHSLKKNALFQFFHGGIHCCVSEEVQAKEKEIDESHYEGDETNFTVLSKTQIIPFLIKRKKDLERTKTTIQNRLADFRQVVGPSIREMKEAMKTFVQIAMKNNDSPVKTKDEQNQQQPGFAANVKDPLEDDIEGTSPPTHPGSIDKTSEGKDETSVTQDNVVSKEQFCIVIRRKRAYKAAFVTLSVVTLFTFYPLPAFDFIFLFIYCNFLMLLITF